MGASQGRRNQGRRSPGNLSCRACFRYAAKSLNQLQSGIKLLYGVVLASANNADRSTIILGKKAALQSKIITPADLKEVAIGGYVIKTAGGKIAIAGNTDACTCYGVEAFLERLGIRFYDGPAVVAFKPANRKIPTLNVADKPALIFRSTVSHALGEWAQASHALKADVTAATDQWIDHSAGYLVPKDLYYDQHPEYYAMMKNGKRIGKDAFTYHRTPLCLSNPDVTKISLERALNWVKMQPDCAFFPITYGDNPFWCACRVHKLDTRPGQYADRLLHWVNPLARAIGEKYPDKIVVTFAYSGTDEPPTKMVPEKNVYIMKAVTFAGRVCFDHDQTAMRKEFDSLERWNRVAPARVGVCTYSSGVYYPALVDFLQGMCRAYLKHHVRAVYFTYGQPATLAGLWQYVYTKLMWDPNLDVQAIAREYVMFHYNPAEKARAMLDYLALCHQRYQDTLKAGDPMDGRPYPHVLTFYSKEFADKALGCLEAPEKPTR